MVPLLSLILLIGAQAQAVRQPARNANDKVSAVAASRYAEALDLWRQGRLAEAQSRAASALELAPGSKPIMKTLGKLDDLVGKYEESILLFQKLAQSAPSDGEAQFDLAIALAQNHQLDQALAVASKAAQEHPTLAAGHRLRAKLLADLHRNEEALLEYQRAEKIAPDDPLTQYDLSLLLVAMGETAQTVVHLQRLVALEPSKPQFHFQLGQALQRAGDTPAAIAQWRETIRLDPGYREALYNLSRVLRRTDPEEAHRLELRFQQIRQSEAVLNSVRDQGNQGVAAMAERNWPQAVSLFRAALEVCAGCELEGNLQKDLGLALCQNGDLSAGEEALQVALALQPADADIVRALGMVRAQRAATSK